MKKKLCLCLAMFIAPVFAMPVRPGELRSELIIYEQQNQRQPEDFRQVEQEQNVPLQDDFVSPRQMSIGVPLVVPQSKQQECCCNEECYDECCKSSVIICACTLQTALFACTGAVICAVPGLFIWIFVHVAQG